MHKIIRDILRYKNGKSLERKDFNEEFNLFMIQRWSTMYEEINVEILNSTVNILYRALDDEQHYKLMMSIIPPSQMKGRYIKATKKKSTKKEQKDVNISKRFEESSDKIDDSLEYVFGSKTKGK